ncbi:hypothetical protein MP228_000129 [Amoeboaphelidium protococcarum]|nr:hypothetical protein MP228_000129 [Amoeboaphelidium protococcarum]
MGNFCCGEPIDYNGEVDLRHFELLRSVGKGAFGKVRIVQKKNDKKIYALKYINKMKCIKMKAVNNVIQERRLLEDIEYPFVVNLRYAFQDDENLFMVLDLMLGGDLRFHLDRAGSMKEEVVRFFVAEVGLGINHLHSKRIVHRDIKPDNVLLDELGHCHLTDFNIAVRYNENTMLKSVAGSMAYMAPEVVGKKGYFASPDWWSLGVVMYELLFGKRPFRGKSNDALTHAILHDVVQFPNNAEANVGKECLDLLKSLLDRDIDKRIGHGEENFRLFKQHPFFNKEINGHGPIDWDLMEQKKFKPPYVPDSKRANFDASHELEELLLEENPLRVKKRANVKDYSKMPGGETGEIATQLQIMEKKFTVFDYQKKGLLMSADNSMAKKSNTSLVKQKVESAQNAVANNLKQNGKNSQDNVSMHDLANFDKPQSTPATTDRTGQHLE